MSPSVRRWRAPQVRPMATAVVAGEVGGPPAVGCPVAVEDGLPAMVGPVAAVVEVAVVAVAAAVAVFMVGPLVAGAGVAGPATVVEATRHGAKAKAREKTWGHTIRSHTPRGNG